MAHFKMFTVGPEINSQIARDLAQHFYSGESIDVVNVNKKSGNLFEGVSAVNLQKLVFLGHANTETFGDFKAVEFVNKLAKSLSTEQKAQVKDLYLVGCEMGLIEGNGVSLAQDICNRLAKNGFTNVQVHSVAKPEHIKGDVMRVSVTTRTGLSSHVGNQIGYISAYTMTKAVSDDYEAESKQRHVLGNAKRMTELEKQFVTFAEFQHPQHFLDEAINVFIPDESPQVRHMRIQEDGPTQEITGVISLLTQRMEYKQAKKSHTPFQRNVDAAEAEFLRGLIEELKHTPAKQWKMPLSKAISEMGETRGVIGFIDKRNKTFLLLKALVAGDFHAANGIIKKQKSKSQPTTSPYATFVALEAAAADQIEADKAPTTENKRPLGRQLAVAKQFAGAAAQRPELTINDEPVSVRGRRAQKIGTSSPAPGFFQSEVRTDAAPIISDLIKTKQAIREMVRVLSDEIAELRPRTGGLHFFNRYEMTTKTVKKVALEGLLNENSIDSLQATAIGLMGDARIMRSAKTSRTRDLLTNIRDSHFDAFLGASKHAHAPVN